ncbi:MAG TPA: amidophosphoribosyltransferase, partial [Spirochaetota bacterium]|nr:amidophosphoribosyltransferase [Spirochaetota bacterium]
QLRDTLKRVFNYGAAEIHMRPACPPLLFSCPFLNFSRSRSELDLAARRAVKDLEGDAGAQLDEYADDTTDRYAAMVEWIRNNLGLTSLKYQKIADLIKAIGLPQEKLCKYCWKGS